MATVRSSALKQQHAGRNLLSIVLAAVQQEGSGATFLLRMASAPLRFPA